MNTDDYVTYEQAVELGELGFDWECFCYYNHYREIVPVTIPYILDSIKRIYAPTLAQAAKWLREKGLFICVWLCASGYGWEIDKCGSPNYNGTTAVIFDEESGDDEYSGLFTTYEKALSDAINKALQTLKYEADNQSSDID